MSQSSTQEFEELSIGTVAGVQAFFHNAQAQFNAGLKKEEVLIEHGNYEYGTALHEIFQKIRQTTNRLIETLKSGDNITQEDADELQGHYDRMVRIIAMTKVKQVSVRSDTKESQVNETEKKAASSLPLQATKKSTPVTSVSATSVKDSTTDSHTNDVKSETKKNRNEKSEKESKLKKEAEKNKRRELTEQSPVLSSNRKPEPFKSLKPKTGSLVVTSDTKKSVHLQNKTTPSKLVKKVETTEIVKPETHSNKNVTESPKSSHATKSVHSKDKSDKVFSKEYKKRIESVIELSKNKYEKLHQQYSETDIVQDLLFEEVREGLEQLEIISKKTNLTKKQVDSASELMSHIKYAMESIEEAGSEMIRRKRQEADPVPIVTERVQQALHEEAPSKQTISFVPSSVTVKKPTVAKRSVPRELQTLPKPADIYETESLTEKYLNAPKYRQFIAEYYSSPAGFERVLDATITKFESDTIDQIEKWLGDLPASAFSFIKDMTVSEFYTFAKRPYEAVSSELERENIKYETFATWRDLTDEMLELVPRGSEMTFGQLFAHWMIEVAMQDFE